MVTDAMRAMILEYFGYSTKVFEFISDLHTPKNVLIVGTRTKRGRDPAALQKLADAKAYLRHPPPLSGRGGWAGLSPAYFSTLTVTSRTVSGLSFP